MARRAGNLSGAPCFTNTVGAWDMNDKNNTTKTVASAMFREVFVALADELDCKKSQVPAYLGISYDIFIKIY